MNHKSTQFNSERLAVSFGFFDFRFVLKMTYSVESLSIHGLDSFLWQIERTMKFVVTWKEYFKYFFKLKDFKN